MPHYLGRVRVRPRTRFSKAIGEATPGVPVPEAPVLLIATAASATSIDLLWTDASADETGFRIERSLDGSTGWAEVTTTAANAESYTDTGLDPETEYFYRAVAVNAGGDSDPSNVDSATTEAAAWSPAALSPSLWLKADVGTFQELTDNAAIIPASANGDPIGTWKDLSGTGKFIVAGTDAKRPTLISPGQNGLPVVRFDGTDDSLRSNVTFTRAQPHTVAMAFKHRTGAGTWVVAGLAAEFSGAQVAGTMYAYAGANVAVSGYTAGSFSSLILGFNDAASTFFWNGTKTTGSPGSAASDGLTVGSNAAGGANTDLDVGEILVFPSHLSDENAALVYAYFQSRWGI